MPLVRICAGGGLQWPSLPRLICVACLSRRVIFRDVHHSQRSDYADRAVPARFVQCSLRSNATSVSDLFSSPARDAVPQPGFDPREIDNRSESGSVGFCGRPYVVERACLTGETGRAVLCDLRGRCRTARPQRENEGWNIRQSPPDRLTRLR